MRWREKTDKRYEMKGKKGNEMKGEKRTLDERKGKEIK